VYLLTSLLLGLNWMDPEWWLSRFGAEMFWVSVVVVFVECGLLFPLLPGDSLLFSIGLFIHRGDIGISLLVACVILSLSAFAGNVVGYEIGRAVGIRLFRRNGRFLNEGNLAKTQAFFERYGARALVLGRFVPVIRTFITVVAGAGEMDRRHFFTWSFVGAALWAVGLTLLGYLVGGNQLIQDNLEAALLLIVAFSTIPIALEWWRHRGELKEALGGAEDAEER
jgi:membrane-associated protein